MPPLHPPNLDDSIYQLTSMMASLQIIDGISHQPSNGPNNADSPPTTNAHISSITAFPNELLMQIFGYLAFDIIQPCLDNASSSGYKQAQKNLRHVCLVSKQMDAVARQYLYRAVVVGNADVLALFLRALDSNQHNGQYVKRLVLEVPFDLKDVRYQRPNVAVLASRPSFSRICELAARCSDHTAYTESRARSHQAAVRFRQPVYDKTFAEWTLEEERPIFGLMQSEILHRTCNLEFLGCDMTNSRDVRALGIYHASFQGLYSILDRPQFLGKLRELQMVGGSKGDYKHFPITLLREFFNIRSLRSLNCLHDSGVWFHVGPQTYPMSFPSTRAPSSGQYSNMRRLELRESKCSLAAFFHICDTFPSLEYLAVYIEYGTRAQSEYDSLLDGFGTRNFLSDQLAKLQHVRQLDLGLQYQRDIKPMLGKHGVLNVSAVKKLTTLRLPLHFLVRAKPGKEPYIPDLDVLLPCSLEQLTVWANMESVRGWGKDPFSNAGLPPAPALEYYPGKLAVDFVDSVGDLCTGHLKRLKQVNYLNADPVMATACECDEDTVCRRCEAWQLLDARAVDDFATRVGIIASKFNRRGGYQSIP